MNHIEAMKQALEALESTQPENPHSIESKAIKSLRQAIAEAEKQVSYSGNGTAGRENTTAPTGFFFQMPKAEKQEPVAWRYTNAKGVFRYIKHRHDLDMAKDFAALDPLPLYATPPAAQRQWVGLTDEEIEGLYESSDLSEFDIQLARHIEAKLKEKNNV